MSSPKATTTPLAETLIQRARLRHLLCDMIDIYSPSGKEEAMMEFAAFWMQERGLKTRMQPVDEERNNVLFLPPGDTKPEFLFMGHLDTVPAYDIERYESQEEEDRIWGLGSADMKGGCAAMMEAFAAWQMHFDAPPPAALALVVGEEENADGALALLEEYHFPQALVAEPTNLSPCLGHYGYLEVQFNTAGERRHASMASPRHNAIRVMLKSLTRLVAYLENQRPEIIYNIRDVHSSEAGFAVADRCEAYLDLHVPPDISIEEVQAEMSQEIQKEEDWPSYVFPTMHKGYQLSEDEPGARLLENLFYRRDYGWTPECFPSDSDASVLHAGGTKCVVLGPGKLSRAHSRMEAVSFNQVARAADIYLEMLGALGKETTLLQ